MKVAVLVLALVAVAAAAPQTFEEWRAQHGKTYTGAREVAMRRAIWTANSKFIESFNKNSKASYTLAMNQFGDLTHTEFRRFYFGVEINSATYQPRGAPHVSSGAPPTSQDWRQAGVVTPVKNQGQCGSCWAFSTTGSLEGAHARKTGKLVSLSEQNLVDCSGAEGNQGCNGGLMDQAFTYIQKNGGIDTEDSYPYQARDGSCRYSASTIGATVSGYVDIKKDDESDLQNAVGTVGPVSVAIDASHPSFQFYSGGVYDPTICSSTRLDHGVLAVGYGTLNGKDYWLVKNSWGESWGMKGYINMARNQNNKCGIASAASYPTV